MRNYALVLILALLCLPAGQASAALFWSVDARTSDGSSLDAATMGAQLILDIGVTTSAPSEFFAGSGSVNNYDPSVVMPNAGASTIANAVFHVICIPTYGCLGGHENLESGLRIESNVEGPGEEATFFSSLQLDPYSGDGAIDEPFPQFQVVFDIVGVPWSTTTLRVGTYEDYSDAYAGVSDNTVHNQTVSITVIPEPSSALLVGVGLVSLAAHRRR